MDPFESRLALPDGGLSARERTLLGFKARYASVHGQLRLLLEADKLAKWNVQHHGGKLTLTDLLADQYPLVIFHGDVGTGKTVAAECIANRIVVDAKAGEAILFKLSNRVRGTGLVGEMGSGLSDAFAAIAKSIGRTRRAILIIDEGDSLAASRDQEQSHHEDKVGVNTLIQSIDNLRSHGGRIVVILCTNRLHVVDPALRRRAAVTTEFARPDPGERRALIEMDMGGLGLTDHQLDELVELSGPRKGGPGWTFSDFRTRLYPAAVAQAYPSRPLCYEDLVDVAAGMDASPAMKGDR